MTSFGVFSHPARPFQARLRSREPARLLTWAGGPPDGYTARHDREQITYRGRHPPPATGGGAAAPRAAAGRRSIRPPRRDAAAALVPPARPPGRRPRPGGHLPLPRAGD